MFCLWIDLRQEMSWQEKVKGFYQKTAHRFFSWVGPVLMVSSSVDEFKAEEYSNRNDKALPKTENIAQTAVSQNNDLSVSIYKPEVYRDIAELDVQKAVRLVSEMTLGELIQKGLVSKEDFRNYQFSAEDFMQMKPGRLGQKLEAGFVAKRLGRPKGECLTGVRSMVARKWGYDVWTHSGEAREWPQQVAKSNMPVVVLGQVKVDSKTLEDKGNIKREDLKLLQNSIVVIDGNVRGQPAGHVSLVCAKFDAYGRRTKTVSYCDGKEDYDTVVEKKIGGGGRRYGDNATVMMPSDVTPSKGLAEFVVHLAAERTDNAVEFCKLLGIEGNQADALMRDKQTCFLAGTAGFSKSDVEQKMSRVYSKLSAKKKTADNLDVSPMLAENSLMRTKASQEKTHIQIQREPGRHV